MDYNLYYVIRIQLSRKLEMRIHIACILLVCVVKGFVLICYPNIMQSRYDLKKFNAQDFLGGNNLHFNIYA